MKAEERWFTENTRGFKVLLNHEGVGTGDRKAIQRRETSSQPEGRRMERGMLGPRGWEAGRSNTPVLSEVGARLAGARWAEWEAEPKLSLEGCVPPPAGPTHSDPALPLPLSSGLAVRPVVHWFTVTHAGQSAPLGRAALYPCLQGSDLTWIQ